MFQAFLRSFSASCESRAVHLPLTSSPWRGGAVYFGMFGSIDASLRYLGDQLKGKYTDEVGKGIWDPC
jgi:hypothetical protein